MDFTQFKKLVKEEFGIGISVYKEKAGHLMVDLYMDGEFLCDGDVTGPGMGHSCSFGKDMAFTCFGWAFAYKQESGWYLMGNGKTGHRQGANPFPHITE